MFSIPLPQNKVYVKVTRIVSAILPRGLYFVIVISEERGKEATSGLGHYKALSLCQASLCVTKIKAAGN